MLYSATSICYINRHLTRNDFGAEIKKTIKWRHFINLIGWQILNSFIFVSAIAAKLNIDYKSGSDHNVLKIFQFIFYSQGLVLPLLRMAEPDFFKIIYEIIWLRREEPSVQLNTLEMILKSDINSEFVYIILEGIS